MGRIEELETRNADLEQQLAVERARFANSKWELLSFQVLAGRIPVGVAIADATGKIVFGNDALAKMVGHSVHHSADFNSYAEWESYHPDGRRVESHEYPLAKVLREDIECSELDVHYQRGDGTRFWMKIIAERIFDEQEELAGAIVVTVDINAEVRLQDEQRVMIAELNHRVKNAFTVSQAIVSRILKTSGNDPELINRIDRRLKAYSAAHAKLVGEDWRQVPISEVARDVVVPIVGDRLIMGGDDLIIPARLALSLSMAFYELATNAIKHGSLSSEVGLVELEWKKLSEAGDARWQIRWIERQGPKVSPPASNGFGSFITGRALAMETRGEVDKKYEETGFEWTLTMPPPYPDGNHQ